MLGKASPRNPSEAMGSMARQGTRELLTLNTAAIIGDPNHPGTARIDFDCDCTGTRIKAVFD
jgi:hypothetical protein